MTTLAVDFQLVPLSSMWEKVSQASLVASLMALDRVSFGNLAQQDGGTAAGWVAIHQKRTDTAFLALDESGAVVGYLEMFPVHPGAAEQIQRGLLPDGAMGPEHVVSAGGTIKCLYLMTIAVHPNWRRAGAARALWNAAINYWSGRASDDVTFFCTIWSEQGRRFFAPVAKEYLWTDARGHTTATLALRPMF